MTNKDELLPCPFCGGSPRYSEGEYDSGHPCFTVSCCSTIDSYEKENVVKWWNTRATQPVDVDQLANFIRKIDGENKLGAGKLAEQIAASGYLRAPLPRIDGLYDAISIEDIPAPNTDKECDNINKRYQDHEAIYGCSVSETLLEAARAYQKVAGV